jgi:hypothetical protein
MSFDYGRLKEISTIADTAASVYSNPVSTKSYVRLIVLHNTNTTSETVVLYNVPDNAEAVGTAADTNKFFDIAIEADGTYIVDLGTPGLILEDTNDSIQAVTTTASKVTIQIMGGTE